MNSRSVGSERSDAVSGHLNVHFLTVVKEKNVSAELCCIRGSPASQQQVGRGAEECARVNARQHLQMWLQVVGSVYRFNETSWDGLYE